MEYHRGEFPSSWMWSLLTSSNCTSSAAARVFIHTACTHCLAHRFIRIFKTPLNFLSQFCGRFDQNNFSFLLARCYSLSPESTSGYFYSLFPSCHSLGHNYIGFKLSFSWVLLYWQIMVPKVSLKNSWTFITGCMILKTACVGQTQFSSCSLASALVSF